MAGDQSSSSSSSGGGSIVGVGTSGRCDAIDHPFSHFAPRKGARHYM